MSIAPARKEIERFLSSSDPEVLCFKGKWGVGKTYAWTDFTKQAKTDNGISLQRYSYVSLFGVSSMEQLKLAIVENTVDRSKIGEPINLESVLSDPIDSTKGTWRRVLPYIPLLPIPGAKDILAAVQSFSFLGVRDQIVCLDDLERKGDGLKIKDVLGLISLLKEGRRCKVAIILNDGAFENNEKDDFTTYFEKTVDSHVEFAPSPQECAEIALPNTSTLDVALKTYCQQLQISNIRAIKRIERLAKIADGILSTYHEQVRDDATKTLCLLGLCEYSEDAPSLDFVINRRAEQLGAINKEPSDDEKKWGPLLDTYKFLYFKDFDKVLKDGLLNGR